MSNPTTSIASNRITIAAMQPSSLTGNLITSLFQIGGASGIAAPPSGKEA